MAVLPRTDRNTGGSSGRWAVDRFGGRIAHLTATYGQVVTVPSGVPTSPFTQTEAQVSSPSVVALTLPGAPGSSPPPGPATVRAGTRP
ncbi:hypothetical protein ACIF83_33680 [Streptomyces sp. NPDC085866]|uniref:hypothetical protein n=1 Tax=unclassified Streptomyces TaxID=2593676 RepID=UPI00379B34CC